MKRIGATMNNQKQNAFSVNATPRAVVSAWKSSENRVKDQGVIWTGTRGTGHKAILGKIVSGTNLTYKGRPLKNELLVDNNVEVRISPDQCDELIDIITDLNGRLFEMALSVEDISIKTLTVNGVPTLSITFFATIDDVREVAAALVGDDFDTQDALDAVLAQAQMSARESAQNASLSMQAVRAAAPSKEDATVSLNAMG